MKYWCTLLLLLFSGAQTFAQWVYEDVVSSVSSNAGLYLDWKKDNTGAYHAAYLDYSNTVLVYAYLPVGSSTWVKEVADPTPNTGFYPSINVDGNNKPHIAYVKMLPAGVGAAGNILYVHKKAATWSTPEIIDQNVGTDDATATFYIELEVDVAGNKPEILYYDNAYKTVFPREFEWDVRHAWKQGSTWRSRQIYGSFEDGSDYGAWGMHPWDYGCCPGSFADYAPRDIGRFLAASRNPNTGRLEVIAPGGPDFGHGDLYLFKQHPTTDSIWVLNGTNKIDSNCVHNPGAIAHCDASADFINNFDTGLNFMGFKYCNFEFASDNSKHLSYRLGKYATSAIDSLLYVRIRPSGSVYRVPVDASVSWNDIYVKGLDTVMMAYYKPSTQQIRFAMSSDTGKTWTTKIIESAPDMERKISVGYHNNKIIVAYYDTKYVYPRLATSADWGNTWTFSYIDFTYNQGSFSDFQVTANDTVRVTYHESIYGNLHYAQRKGATASWTQEVIDSVNHVGRFNKLQFDNNNTKYPVTLYYDLTQKDLKMAAYNGTSWVKSVVDSNSTSDIGTNLSFVINPSNNRYHVAYRVVNTKQQVWYAYSDNKGASWTKMIVDSATVYDVGSFISLALDNTGNPYVAYQNFNTNKIKFAYKSSAIDWQDTTLFASNTDLVGRFLDLKMDASNNPVISYYNNTANAIECIYKKTGTWTKERLYNALTSFGHTSLALTSNKYYLSFYDDFTKSYRVLYRNNTTNVWYQIDVPIGSNIGLIGESSRLKITGNDLVLVGKKNAFLNKGVGKMYAANGLNIIGNPITLVSVEENALASKNVIQLHANYPNPTSGQNNLSLTLQEAQTIQIELYDRLGNKVQTLQESTYLSPGTYNFNSDFNDLSAGFYLYRIITNNQSLSQPLILTK